MNSHLQTLSGVSVCAHVCVRMWVCIHCCQNRGTKLFFSSLIRVQWSFVTRLPASGFPAERRVKMCWRWKAWRPLACCRVGFSLEANRHCRVVSTRISVSLSSTRYTPSHFCNISLLTFSVPPLVSPLSVCDLRSELNEKCLFNYVCNLFWSMYFPTSLPPISPHIIMTYLELNSVLAFKIWIFHNSYSIKIPSVAKCKNSNINSIPKTDKGGISLNIHKLEAAFSNFLAYGLQNSHQPTKDAAADALCICMLILRHRETAKPRFYYFTVHSYPRQKYRPLCSYLNIIFSAESCRVQCWFTVRSAAHASTKSRLNHASKVIPNYGLAISKSIPACAQSLGEIHNCLSPLRH